jgi:D-alanine-D-alanine ligase
MKFAVVHDVVRNSSAPDVRDVIVQAEAVEHALATLGHESCRLECSLNLADVQKELIASGANLVFNLVESISGKGRLIHLFPFCLGAMAMPYTGARAEAMMLTSNKVAAKQWMAAADIPSPQWIVRGPEDGCQGPDNFRDSGPWIIKSVWEHASIGLGCDSLVHSTSKALLRSMLQSRAALLGGDCFAERFIEGREFNLSLLAGPGGPNVLPPAEILFEGYTEDMPRIVDYQAKWDDTTYEYHHTPRHFDFDESDQIILKKLKALAIRCWNHFGLSGYARVDFRVDIMGNPWVLEINANPCLSPDAGFAAALERAGIPYAEAVERIIADANHSPAEPVGTWSLGKKEFKERLQDVVCLDEPAPLDIERIRNLVEITGFFSPEEVDVAGELVAERIAKGPESGYEFVMADHYGRLVGYTCFGPIPCTFSSYDLYWIAVHPDFQGRGLGGRLIMETEKRIKALGGTRIYLDTSQRVQYSGTRRFYESCGYRLETVLKDFYAAGDGKAIYVKSLV